MRIEIRRIGRDDWRLLKRLRLAALDDSPGAFGQRLEEAAQQPDAEWVANARSSSAGDRRAWFIGRLDGEDVGLVHARRRPPDDCLVFSMWVAPAVRRSGVGRLLLDAVDDWAAGWGATAIVLWVVAGNDGAVRFYRKLGFQVLDRGADTDAGAAYGALAMRRPIEDRSGRGDVG